MGHLAHPPVPFKRSLDYSFTFPVQEFRLKSGDADDPTTGESYKVVAVEENHSGITSDDQTGEIAGSGEQVGRKNGEW